MTPLPFQYRYTIPLQDIDAAGVVFFAHLFRYAHEAYEAFMAESGHSLAQLLREGVLLLPLVHAEADYSAPLRHGEQITIELRVKSVGERSFTLQYHCLDEKAQIRAVIETVHVALDSATQRPLPLPPWLREVLSAGGIAVNRFASPE